MLDDNPEFLVVRGSTRLEIVIFAAALALGAPLLAVLAERLAALVSHRGGDVLHLLFLGLFVIPLTMFFLKALDPGAIAAVVAAAIGSVALVGAYLRWRQVRTFLTLSLVLPVIGFSLFVTGIPVVVDDAAGARLRVSRDVPVVVVVLDEFPASSLLASDGRIDAIRYPSFARLARDATWYPRATTVHDFTAQSVPAILSGRLTPPGQVPSLADHPQNLFTLLGESYRMRVHEIVTYLCPKRYCPRRRDSMAGRLRSLFSDVGVAFLHRVLPDSLARGLPPIGDRWSGSQGTACSLRRTKRMSFTSWQLDASRSDGSSTASWGSSPSMILPGRSTSCTWLSPTRPGGTCRPASNIPRQPRSTRS